MSKLVYTLLFICSAFSVKAQNLILNGSFEINNPVSTYTCISLADGNFSDVTNYGGIITFIKDSCLVCPSQTFWGGGAAEGNWFIEMVSDNFPQISGDKLSFDISAPLSLGNNYKLTFSIRKPPPTPNGCVDPTNNYINIGISNYDNQFGTLLYTSPLGNDEWQEYSIVFNTQNNEEYLTVEVATEDSSNHVVFVDNFVLVETTEQPNAIYEIKNNKQLLKIVDILGRESESKKGLLFYIYSDGTVEKKLIIE